MTHTRTHVFVTFANPYLRCNLCHAWVTRWHNNDKCGCTEECWLEPCDHNSGSTSACPSWDPVDGCQCQEHLGRVDHGQPPTAGARQDEARPSTPPCAHCTHPKSDHDGRTDHRAKYSPLVAGEPWCHACNAPCDYTAAGARQDGAGQ